jgi:hypothetical protein
MLPYSISGARPLTGGFLPVRRYCRNARLGRRTPDKSAMIEPT